jgi:hypothetical protein
MLCKLLHCEIFSNKLVLCLIAVHPEKTTAQTKEINLHVITTQKEQAQLFQRRKINKLVSSFLTLMNIILNLIKPAGASIQGSVSKNIKAASAFTKWVWMRKKKHPFSQ